MSDLRIGFAGASGTGKSTLAAIVSDKFGLPVNPVGSRSVAKAMGFASPYDVDAAGKRAEFQKRLMSEKIAWEAAHDRFVADRTTIDNLAYTAFHDVHAIDRETIDAAALGLRRYTHVIYCPVSAFCSVGDDPARVKDAAYHELYDALLFGLLEKYEVRGIWMTCCFRDLDVRVEEVCKYVTEGP